MAQFHHGQRACPGCNGMYDLARMEILHELECAFNPYTPAIEVVQAQIDGEPLEFTPAVAKFEDDLAKVINTHSMEAMGGNTPDFVLAQFLAGALKLYGAATAERSRLASPTIESNFGFYVDGYRMLGTENIGEVLIVRNDGKTIVLKSKRLTDFFDRRIDFELGTEGDGE